jgi:hypothetical protein
MFVLLSCGRVTSVPSGVLAKDKMQAILWDLLRAEQFVTNYIVVRDTTAVGRAKGPQLYDAILKRHGITDAVFQSSLEYYKSHPQSLYPILDSLAGQTATAPTPLVTPQPASPDTVKSAVSEPVPVSPTPNPMPAEKNRPSFAPKPMAY